MKIGDMKEVVQMQTYVNGEIIFHTWFEIWDGKDWVSKFWKLQKASDFAEYLTLNGYIKYSDYINEAG